MKKIILGLFLILFAGFSLGFSVNNISSYSQVNIYWGDGVGDYLYSYIKNYLKKLLNGQKITSFKQLDKINKIHNKIQASLNTNLPPKVRYLLAFVDDLLYRYSDILYKDLLTPKDTAYESNPTYETSIVSSSANEENNSINLNHGQDNINKQLLKQYMCKDYNKTFIDFGCGTSPASFNKKFIKNTVEHQKAMLRNTIHWDKYKLKELYSYFDKTHFMNVIYNWLYKVVYLSSPAGFVKLFYYNVQYVNGAIPESYDTIFVNGQTNIIADGIQNSLEELGKFIAENPQYNVDKTSMFKNLIGFLKKNYLDR